MCAWKYNELMDALVEIFVVGELSEAHPGWREIRLHDPNHHRHTDAVMLVSEVYLANEGLEQGDELEIWNLNATDRQPGRQVDIFEMPRRTENIHVRQTRQEEGKPGQKEEV